MTGEARDDTIDEATIFCTQKVLHGFMSSNSKFHFLDERKESNQQQPTTSAQPQEAGA